MAGAGPAMTTEGVVGWPACGICAPGLRGSLPRFRGAGCSPRRPLGLLGGASGPTRCIGRVRRR